MEQLVNFIIRPPRAEYNPKYDLLEQQFRLRGKLYKRKDVEVKNSRGDTLQCSHYMPVVSPEGKPLPCVIYCHGNSGCRVDASETAIVLLPSNITVFALDFSGSGLSGGEHVSLGWHEKDDLKAVVEYLRTEGNVSLIGLWGRSMGAVTSLMYGAEDPSIAGMVLDSPFSDLVELMMELADTQAFRLPKFTVKLAIQYMRRAIQKKANFDISDLNATKFAKSCFVPVLFGHGIEDDFIRPHHSDRIFEAYMGDKNIIKFEGDHNSTRPQFYFDSVNIFFHNVLQPPEDGPSGSVYSSMHDYFGKVDWSNVSPDGGYTHEPSTVSGGPSSVENGSGQTCSRSSPNRTENMENGDVASASSSFNFELSNGHPYGPHVPTIPDDEQYLEYQLDDLSGFPCTAEEEEKMLMEAVLLSLQDVKPPDTKLNSNGEGGDEQVKTELPSTSTSTENATSVSGSERKVEEGSSSSTKSPSTSTENATSVSGSEGKVEGSSSNASVSVITPSVTETSDSTRTAAVSSESNPGTQVIEGLVRRWDLSFFKNGRS